MEPRPPTSENRYTRKAPYLLVGLLLILFRAAAVTGPDFDHYMHWSRAFQTLDTRIFLDEGHTLSPLGVPLSQWSHGPGLLYALCPVGCAQWMSPDRQALWISWIVTAAFWWAMVGLLRRASYGDPQWVIYGVLVAVVGTQLGFYSRSYASETLSQAVFALLALWVVTRRDWRALDALVVGCLAGLLAIIRSQLVIYALPLLALLAFDLWRTRGTRPARATAGLVAAVLIPFLIGLAQVSMANRWMTGSLLDSPYAFGNGTFRSLDFARPALLAVLFHPLHGWFLHHPLYILGLVALGLLAIRSRNGRERLLYGGFALVIGLNVILQAAWYVWWLGMQTFGMRGLSISAVVLVPVLVRYLRERELRGQSNTLWGLMILMACLWSAPLFSASLYAEVGWLTFADVGRFYAGLAQPVVLPLMVLLTAVAIALWVFPRIRIPALRRRQAAFTRQIQTRPALSVSMLLLGPIAVYGLLKYGLARSAPAWGLSPDAVRLLALATIPASVALMAWFLALPDSPAQDIRGVTRPNRMERVVAVAVLAVLAVSTAVFVRFTFHLERQIAARAFPTSGVQYVAATHVREVEESFFEYLSIAGFEDRKAALKNYLLELQACAAATSEAEILPRLVGIPRFERTTSVGFGNDLRLTGVTLIGGASAREPVTFRPGDIVGVATRWDVLNALPSQKFSLRLHDSAGRQWAAVDYWPKVSCGSPDGWQTGTGQEDAFGLTLPSDLPPGPYELALIVYGSDDGTVLFSDQGESTHLGEILVAAAPQPDVE